MLFNAVLRDPTTANHKALQDELDHRENVENIFNVAFVKQMPRVKNHTYPLATKQEDFDCYKKLIGGFETKCGQSNYAKKYFGAFLGECYDILNGDLNPTMKRLDKVCPPKAE